MLKNRNSLENDLFKQILPDNRPITALQIVQDSSKCPRNFTPVCRTYDQDADADLWRDVPFFGRKINGRYLCLSKTEGLQDYVVETIQIIGDKQRPPEGFSLLTRTADSGLRAWRKRQVIYRLAKMAAAKQAITDIILCSRVKKAPEGFALAGEINGILICYKLLSRSPGKPPAPLPPCAQLPPPVPYRSPPEKPPNSQELVGYMNQLNLGQTASHETHNYEILRTMCNMAPSRPAPTPPARQQNVTLQYNNATLGNHGGLDGVPFILHPKLIHSNVVSLPQFQSAILNSDLDYNFSLERQVLNITK